MTDSENEFGGGSFGGQFSSLTGASVKSLIDAVLTAAGINTDDTEYRARLLTFANYRYLNIMKGRHWKCAHREIFRDMQAPYNSGTVTLTKGSSLVTEDSVVPSLQWNATMLGQAFSKGTGHYRIGEVVDSKNIRLASSYAEDSAALSGYEILFDRYTLDAKVKTITSISVSGVGEVKPVGRQEFFSRKSESPNRTGSPQIFTLLSTDDQAETQSGQWTVEFFPAPDKRYSMLIEYIARPMGLEDSETCFTMIPPDHLDVLYFFMLADTYINQENPTLADMVGKQAAAAWNRFASDQDMTDSVARVKHQRKYFNRGRSSRRGYFGLRWFGRVED